MPQLPRSSGLSGHQRLAHAENLLCRLQFGPMSISRYPSPRHGESAEHRPPGHPSETQGQPQGQGRPSTTMADATHTLALEAGHPSAPHSPFPGQARTATPISWIRKSVLHVRASMLLWAPGLSLTHESTQQRCTEHLLGAGGPRRAKAGESAHRIMQTKMPSTSR